MIDRDQTVSLLILISLVCGGLIPYIRAKAESMSIECSGGFAERTERVVLSLTAIGLYGLGIDFALIVGFAILSAAGIFTVLQRMVIVYRALHKV
jgi:CDP-diacylglycerol---glycerol-3-phosphate 3-phosphatidyltransferase